MIVLGVGGGIAAYKAAELLRLFTGAGHQVRVVPTRSALRFVGAPTWQALSGQPVTTDVFDDAEMVPHVGIARSAELVVVAPATADLIARAAHGLADDLLTNILLMVGCPVLYAPAMHTEMWRHRATQTNIQTLRRRGAAVLEPAVGPLTGAEVGIGRLPEAEEIFAAAQAILHRGDRPADLTGRRVVVTAGGTREPIDPVRFLGNHSSGKQGYAFARAALARGARVTLIAANVELPDPAGVEVIRVGTTEEMRSATVAAAKTASVVVMAGAPADFRPSAYVPSKIRKGTRGAAPKLTLVTNPDIAAEVGAAKEGGQILVIFAAETASAPEALASATEKLGRKKADLVVVNQVGEDLGFGVDTNAAVVVDADGATTAITRRTKDEVANAVLDLVVPMLARPGPAA